MFPTNVTFPKLTELRFLWFVNTWDEGDDSDDEELDRKLGEFAERVRERMQGSSLRVAELLPSLRSLQHELYFSESPDGSDTKIIFEVERALGNSVSLRHVPYVRRIVTDDSDVESSYRDSLESVSSSHSSVE